jgi:hypothetical protein
VGVWKSSTHQAELVNLIAVERVIFGSGSRQSGDSFQRTRNGWHSKRGKRLSVAEIGKLQTMPESRSSTQ